MKRIELRRGSGRAPIRASVAVQNQRKDLIEQPTQHRASGVVVSLHSGKRSPQNSQVGPTCGIYSLGSGHRECESASRDRHAIRVQALGTPRLFVCQATRRDSRKMP
jgi:hypothetical protein